MNIEVNDRVSFSECSVAVMLAERQGSDRLGYPSNDFINQVKCAIGQQGRVLRVMPGGEIVLLDVAGKTFHAKSTWLEKLQNNF